MSIDQSCDAGRQEDQGVTASPPLCRPPGEAADASSAKPAAANAERPWLPHERNYSGGRIGVQQQDEWTILRVESGVGDTTTSLRDHEAWDLAMRLSPALVERIEYLFGAMKKAQDALHQFTWADAIAPVLRKVADDWDCDSATCEFASSDMGGLSCPHIERDGCRAVEADELRKFADALELAAEIRARDAQSSQPPSGSPS